jgi:hypothetical protein
MRLTVKGMQQSWHTMGGTMFVVEEGELIYFEVLGEKMQEL